MTVKSFIVLVPGHADILSFVLDDDGAGIGRRRTPRLRLMPEQKNGSAYSFNLYEAKRFSLFVLYEQVIERSWDKREQKLSKHLPFSHSQVKLDLSSTRKCDQTQHCLLFFS